VSSLHGMQRRAACALPPSMGDARLRGIALLTTGLAAEAPLPQHGNPAHTTLFTCANWESSARNSSPVMLSFSSSTSTMRSMAARLSLQGEGAGDQEPEG